MYFISSMNPIRHLSIFQVPLHPPQILPKSPFLHLPSSESHALSEMPLTTRNSANLLSTMR